jgi:hypothetical protein
MCKRRTCLVPCAAIATLIAFSGVVAAGAAAPGDPAIVATAPPERPHVLGKPYSPAVTPAVYLVNFLLLYISNPNAAANMPAYRATIPAALSDCLKVYPEGCPYDAFARFFDDQPADAKCAWPPACREDPKWEQLAPSVAKHPDQINEPLGTHRANRLAARLGIDQSMILTPLEYLCTIGTPPRNSNQQTIFSCIQNLTNSNGNADTPLSSYGLALTDQGDVQSVCAPQAPCLVFNQLFEGPLEQIAKDCGWARKLERMVRKTPFLQFVDEGHKCQTYAGAPTGPCIVEPICPPRRLVP